MNIAIGEVFKEARLRLGLSVEEVSKMLNIRRQYIIALESDDLSGIPSGVYVHGYRKLYSRLLGIEYEETEVKNGPAPVRSRELTSYYGRLPVVLSLMFFIIAGLGFYVVATSQGPISEEGIVNAVQEASPDQHLNNIVAPQIVVPYRDCRDGSCNETDNAEEE